MYLETLFKIISISENVAILKSLDNKNETITMPIGDVYCMTDWDYYPFAQDSYDINPFNPLPDFKKGKLHPAFDTEHRINSWLMFCQFERTIISDRTDRWEQVRLTEKQLNRFNKRYWSKLNANP